MEKFFEGQTIKVHLKIDCLHNLKCIKDIEIVVTKNLPTPQKNFRLR